MQNAKNIIMNLDFTKLDLTKYDDDFISMLKSAESNADIKNVNNLFHESIVSKHIEVIKLLIDAGIDVNMINKYGTHALLVSILNADEDIARLLVANGADINIASDSISAIAGAVLSRNENILKLLIDNGADVNNVLESGTTILMLACMSGVSKKIIELLIDAGADVNAIDSSGETAYSHARQAMFKDATMLLNKADATKVGNYKKKEDSEFNYFIENNDNYLCQAFRTKDVEKLKMAMKDAYFKDEISIAELMFTESTLTDLVKENYPFEFIKMIIEESNIDINSVDSNGKTALIIASLNENEQLVALFIENNATLNIKDNDGDEAFDYAENKCMLSLNAAVQDRPYSCIAFQKVSNNKTQRLDMKQSLVQGGYYSFSMKINFLRAEVTLNKNTIKNIDYPAMRFAYRADVKDYILYVYEYDKDYFIIEKGDKKDTHLTMTFYKGDKMHYICKMWDKNIMTNHESRFIKSFAY